MKIVKHLLLISVIILLAGCSNANSTDASTNDAAIIQPTIDPGMAQVKGCLKVNDAAVERMNLFLAPVIVDNTGKEIVASLETTTDPAAVTDKNGCFQFVNVPPGAYAFIYEVGTMGNMILDKDGVTSMILRISGAENIDLGELNGTD